MLPASSSTRLLRPFLLVAAFLAMPAATAQAEKKPTPVVVWAIAWNSECGGNSIGYALEVSDSANWKKAGADLKASVANEYGSRAKGVRTGSTVGASSEIRAVSVISVDNSEPNCKSRAIFINFGKTEQEAQDKSIAEAKKRPYEKLRLEYFVKVESAPSAQ